MIGTTAALIAAGMMAGGSVASGALNGRSKTSTTTSTPTYTPGQMDLQGTLNDTLKTKLADPSAGLAPLKKKAIGNVNQTFKGAGTRLEANLASRGFERSGAVPSGFAEIEKGRASAISGIDADFAGKELDQQNRILELIQRSAYAQPGQTSTSTGPGNVAGSAVSGGLETAMMLYGLNKMLGGGGGSMPGMGGV